MTRMVLQKEQQKQVKYPRKTNTEETFMLEKLADTKSLNLLDQF